MYFGCESAVLGIFCIFVVRFIISFNEESIIYIYWLIKGVNDNILSFTILLYINTYHNKVFILFMMYVKMWASNIISINKRYPNWFQSRDLDTVHSAYTDTIGTRYFISYLRRSLTGGGTRFLHFLLFIFYRKWEMLRHVFVVEI